MEYAFLEMTVKKRKKKNIKKNKGIASIASLTTKSISVAFSNYKKNKELKKFNQLNYKTWGKKSNQKERKELRNWEEKLIKESNKLKLKDEELRLKEKEIKTKEEIQKIESERLTKRWTFNSSSKWIKNKRKRS